MKNVPSNEKQRYGKKIWFIFLSLIWFSTARMAIVSTLPRFGYDQLWIKVKGKSHIAFGVRCCHDALLALAEELGVASNSYEVCIGGYGNTKSSIRKEIQKPNDAEVLTPGLMSCNETRFFWVSWANGLIEMGQGLTVGLRRFLYWKDSNPRFNVTAIGISGWNQEDEWEFNHDDG